MGSHEKALEEEAITGGIRTEFIAKARRRQVIGCGFDQFGLAGDIASRRSNAAAGVLDKRTGNDIGTGFNRFPFRKFTL